MATVVLQFGRRNEPGQARIELELAALGPAEQFNEWLLSNPGQQAVFSRLNQAWIGGPVISVRRIQECEACQPKS